MKVLLFLPYFGKFPNYFKLYLHTASANYSIDWLLITDDKSDYNFPKNVKVIYKSFEDIRNLIQTKFDFKICLDRPHKLCDFKPAYGYIFEEYLTNVDYWGHCDPDLIWGNFSTLLDFNELSKYEKVCYLGHLTFYKNTILNNRRFMLFLKGEERYKKVFSNPIGFAFDEKFNYSINSIFKENGIPILAQNNVADIDPYHTNFRLSLYNINKNTYTLDSVKKQIFVWENGHLFRFYFNSGILIKEEFLYIHLQKRSMTLNFDSNFPNQILITHDGFYELEEPINEENFHSYYKFKWFNTQYFKVKWNSFLYKLKFSSYFYGFQKHI